MKLLVKPTSQHGYIDSSTYCEIQPFRPSVVESSYFLTTLFGVNKVKLISNQLVEEATDEEFARFYTDSGRDEDLAVSSFMSKFGVESTFEKVGETLVQAGLREAQVKAEKEAAENLEAEAKAVAKKLEDDDKAAADKEAADKAEAEAKAVADKEAADKAEAEAKSQAQKANEKTKG